MPRRSPQQRPTNETRGTSLHTAPPANPVGSNCPAAAVRQLQAVDLDRCESSGAPSPYWPVRLTCCMGPGIFAGRLRHALGQWNFWQSRPPRRRRRACKRFASGEIVETFRSLLSGDSHWTTVGKYPPFWRPKRSELNKRRVPAGHLEGLKRVGPGPRGWTMSSSRRRMDAVHLLGICLVHVSAPFPDLETDIETGT